MRVSLRRKIIRLAATLLLFNSCTHLQKNSPQTESPSRKAGLISNLKYHLWFAVNGSDPEFEGRSTILFDWIGSKYKKKSPIFKKNEENVGVDYINLLIQYQSYEMKKREMYVFFSGHDLKKKFCKNVGFSEKTL